jgi:hypothetical protein
LRGNSNMLLSKTARTASVLLRFQNCFRISTEDDFLFDLPWGGTWSLQPLTVNGRSRLSVVNPPRPSSVLRNFWFFLRKPLSWACEPPQNFTLIRNRKTGLKNFFDRFPRTGKSSLYCVLTILKKILSRVLRSRISGIFWGGIQSQLRGFRRKNQKFLKTDDGRGGWRH